jgi:hypothetical protein
MVLELNWWQLNAKSYKEKVIWNKTNKKWLVVVVNKKQRWNKKKRIKTECKMALQELCDSIPYSILVLLQSNNRKTWKNDLKILKGNKVNRGNIILCREKEW